MACSKLGGEGIRATISKSRTVTVQSKNTEQQNRGIHKVVELALEQRVASLCCHERCKYCKYVHTHRYDNSCKFMPSFYDLHKNDTLIITIWSSRQSVHIKNNFTDNNICHENLICNISNSQKNSLLSFNRYSQVIYPAPG